MAEAMPFYKPALRTAFGIVAQAKSKSPLLAKEARNGVPGRPSPRRQQTVRSNPALAARHPVPLRHGMVPLCSCKVMFEHNGQGWEVRLETGQS
jgi:hypothetical protein